MKGLECHTQECGWDPGRGDGPGEVTVPRAARLTGWQGGEWTEPACLQGQLSEGGSGVNRVDRECRQPLPSLLARLLLPASLDVKQGACRGRAQSPVLILQRFPGRNGVPGSEGRPAG